MTGGNASVPTLPEGTTACSALFSALAGSEPCQAALGLQRAPEIALPGG